MGSFSFGLIVFLLIPLTGIWAFPGLGKYCFYNIVFDQSPVKWAYYIISFYMFLNIAALPVLTITIRKNLMKLLVPHLLPKNSFQITKASVAFTLLISIPCTILTIGTKLIIYFVFSLIRLDWNCGWPYWRSVWSVHIINIPCIIGMEGQKNMPRK